MMDTIVDTHLNQITADCGIVQIIPERLVDGLRDHQASSKVDGTLDIVGLDDSLHSFNVAGVAFEKWDIGGNRVSATGGEKINHDDLVARLAETPQKIANAALNIEEGRTRPFLVTARKPA